MKILVVIPSSATKTNGVDYHRMLIPHVRIGKNNPESEINVCNDIEALKDEQLINFDLIIFNRFISRSANEKQVYKRLLSLNLPYVLDMDDDYRLHISHPLYEQIRLEKHADKIMFAMKNAMAITAASKLLAETLKKESGNQNVFVVQNGIDSSEPQFQVNEINLPNLTFGWTGGASHFDDVLLLHDSLLALYLHPDFCDTFRFVYGGYDKSDAVSQSILGVLTCKGIADTTQFDVFPATDVDNYATFYDNINVALIPLRENRFNSLKSNLKLLEAGFKKKAVIVSDVEPYKSYLKHGVNCLVVKNKHDWYRHMVYLIKNPHIAIELAEQLYQDVQVFEIDNIAKRRFNIYKKLCNQ
jgi:glycosyltransferase involved in cell wall biosynthesis